METTVQSSRTHDLERKLAPGSNWRVARSFAVSFATVLALVASTLANAASVDFTAGTIFYGATTGTIENIIDVSLAGGAYTIADAGEALQLGPGAIAHGCAPVDVNTVRCPAPGITYFDLATLQGDDEVSLAGIPVGARVLAGPGNDDVVGGAGDDTFPWFVGDGSDTIEGNGGLDMLVFNGNAGSEVYEITADGAGFELFRNLASVRMSVQGAEALLLSVGGGADTVFTTPLESTEQAIQDGIDTNTDAITVDAGGRCMTLADGRFETVGRKPIQTTGFTTTTPTGVRCGALLDWDAGTLRYDATPDRTNDLAFTRSGDFFAIDDPGETAISVTNAAVAQGCLIFDSNTIDCPVAAVAAVEVSVSEGDDIVLLSDVGVPARIVGGPGTDLLVGGSADDEFAWAIGDGNDSIDGGGGMDALDFTGSPADEIFVIRPEGEGFVLTRDIANVSLQGLRVEDLRLSVQGGFDVVTTSGLASTEQHITDGTDAFADTLRIDANDLCVTREGDRFDVEGRRPIHFAGFSEILVEESSCRADPCDVAVPSAGCVVNGVRNQLCQGTDGDDVILGTRDDDVIKGGGGRDRIRGAAGSDVLCGEDGDDSVQGSAGDDTIVGGEGDDRLKGDGGADTLFGSEGDDDLIGGGDGDDLDGGSGDDVVRGGADEDVLRGGAGRDRIDGGSSTDTCSDADQSGPFPRCEG